MAWFYLVVPVLASGKHDYLLIPDTGTVGDILSVVASRIFLEEKELTCKFSGRKMMSV
jgi:hypothetical protein